MSLRLRLTLFIAITATLSLASLGLLGYWHFQRSGLEDLDHDLEQFIAQFIVQLRPEDRDFSKVQANFEDYTVRVRLVSAGTVMYQQGKSFPEAVGATSSEPHSVGHWRIASLELPGMGEHVSLDVAISSRDFEAGLSAYRQSIALSALALALLGAGVGWWLADYALIPLERVTATAQRVADSGNLRERVPAQPPGELRQLGNALNHMLERLGAFRQREVAFTRYASHELRTPLTAMQLCLDEWREGQVSAEETYGDVSSQVTRMRTLTESLLVLARENTTASLPFDLAALTAKVATRYDAQYTGPQAMTWQGDPVLIERAFENLLENAAKYAPQAKVRVRLEAAALEAHLIVEDDGPGLSPAALERATEAFYRAPDAQGSGSGLGLTVVAHIAEAHGGQFKLEPCAPHGLRAHLTLRQPAER